MRGHANIAQKVELKMKKKIEENFCLDKIK